MCETSPCPRCGEPVPICEVGTVACHRECDYCTHPAVDWGICQVCGATQGDPEWFERQAIAAEARRDEIREERILAEEASKEEEGR